MLDVAVVFGVNLLIVSPYLVMLLVGYPFLTPLAAQPDRVDLAAPAGADGARWGSSSRWACGAPSSRYRRGDRLGRAWTAQVVGIYVVWVGYLVLSAMHQARERDEVHHWLRLLIAVSAGIGAWDLAGAGRALLARAGRRARAAGRRPAGPGGAVVAAVLVGPGPHGPVLPGAPCRRSSRTLAEPAEFIRRHAAPRDVVASDPDYSRWIAALGARRVLRDGHTHRNADHADREAVLETLLRRTDAAQVRAAAARYRVRYLVATPALLEQHPGVTLDTLAAREHWEPLLYTQEGEEPPVVVFRLTAGPDVPR